jgi:hypothetical protein
MSGKISYGLLGEPALSLRTVRKALHGKNDDDLRKSAKTFTLYCTVSHLSFWVVKEYGSK